MMIEETLFYSIVHPLVNVAVWGRYENCGNSAVVVAVELKRERKEIPSIPFSISMKSFGESIGRYLDGENSDLSSIPLDLDWCTPFQRKVLEAARAIQYGKTLSYMDLARNAGVPAAIRAVASVMRHNRFPLLIPCHRVIKSDGTVGGFSGRKSGYEVELKRRFIAMERSIRIT
jgi:O-6-methylguanine DNA methyltransferase